MAIQQNERMLKDRRYSNSVIPSGFVWRQTQFLLSDASHVSMAISD